MFVLRFSAFLISNVFRKKIEIALIISNIILLTYTPINQPIENLFVRTYFYLCKSLVICENLFESLLIYGHLEESIFLSLYENKLAYEHYHLKQIFYHQNTIVIFC